MKLKKYTVSWGEYNHNDPRPDALNCGMFEELFDSEDDALKKIDGDISQCVYEHYNHPSDKKIRKLIDEVVVRRGEDYVHTYMDGIECHYSVDGHYLDVDVKLV